MSSSSWIAIYVPLLVIFFVVIPNQREMQKLIIRKIRMRKGVIIMINEAINKYIGKNCKISSGSFGTNVTGKISGVKENWIEVETRKGIELVNADFVQSIKIKSS